MARVRKKWGQTQPPSAEEVKEARLNATKTLGLEKDMTQTEAAIIVHGKLRAWQDWEGGQRDMNPAVFELFLIKTAQSREFGPLNTATRK
jgi:hypothetical protein